LVYGADWFMVMIGVWCLLVYGAYWCMVLIGLWCLLVYDVVILLDL
jgi:hypothetical protein